MVNKVLYWVVFICIGFIVSSPSQAVMRSCEQIEQTITHLKKPGVGSYSVRNFTDGDYKHEEILVHGLPQPEWGSVAVGTIREKAVEDEDDEKPAALLFVKFDHRGRSVWRKVYNIEGFQEAVEVMPVDQGFVVVGNVSLSAAKNHIWFGLFDENGDLTGERTIKHERGAVAARDIILDQKSGTYVLAAQALYSIHHAVFYKLNKNLNVVDRKAFMIGAENGVHSIDVTPESHVVAAGYALNGYGRSDGWIMRLDHDLNMMWQRPYGRGKGAALESIHVLDDMHVVVSGHVLARDDTGQAAWAMNLDMAAGDIVWQRYYTSEYDIGGRDILIEHDKRISVLISGTLDEDKKDNPGYVRLLTLNKEGMALGHNDYFNGEGAQAVHMFFDEKKQRIIVGRSIMPVQIENSDTNETQTVRSLDGWVVVGDRAGKFIDPCVKAP